MLINHKRINKWGIVGFFWIVIVGTLLHFTYEWSGKLALVGLLSPVNESVWEHLKLGYFALLFFMLIEYWFIRRETRNFFIANAVGVIAMNLIIVIVYYSYTLFVSTKDNIVVNIGSFVVGALICQILSTRIMKMKVKKRIETFGLAVFILLGGLFFVFTIYTPHYPLFKDPPSGKYGL